MVDKGELDDFRVDTTVVVVVEVVGGVDTARDGSVLEGSLHLVGTFDVVVLADVVEGVVSDGGAAVEATVANGRGRSSTVTALVNGSTTVLNIVVSYVVHAGSMDETMGHGELIDLSGVATVAGAASVTVDDHLCADSDRGGDLVSKVDVEAISDGGG